MKMARILMTVIVILLLLVLYAGHLYGQQGRGGRQGDYPGSEGPKHPGPKVMPPDYADGAFNMDTEQLPSRYLGQNPEAVCNRMVQGRSGDGLYAFQIFPERSYDSRGQALEIYCDLDTVRERGRENLSLRGMRVKFVPQMDNRYVITDRTGRRLDIEELKFEEYLAVFDNFREFTVEKVILPSTKETRKRLSKKEKTEDMLDEGIYREAIVGRIQLKPEDARHLKDAFAVLLIGSPEKPFTSSETVQRKGTPERLGQYMARFYYLHMRLLEIWFYDFETGKIFLKMKPGLTSQ